MSSIRYNRRNFLKAVGLSATALALPGCKDIGSKKSGTLFGKKRPNIVFIMADDMGYGDVGCYNPESKIPTPNMDRLAKEGMRFTDAHSPSAVCTPTRYGILTGRYCWRSRLKKGVLLGYVPPLIETSRMTVASLLKQHEYKTAYIGKWHLGLIWETKDGSDPDLKNQQNIDFSKPIGGGPTELGFDYFFGTSGCSTSDPPYCFIENNRTVGIPNVMSTEELHKHPGFVPGLMTPDWSEEDVDPILTQKAIDFIDNHQKNTSNEPFFLYLSFSSPHIPFLTPDFIKGRSKEGPRGDLVALVDWCVGQVLDSLDRLGLKDNTLVVVTSDNGPRKGAKGHKSAGDYRGRKGQIWEGGHRVPFIARWPGKIKPDSTCDEVICLTDMLATFAAITGTELPNNAGEDSYNILPALKSKQRSQSIRQATVFHSSAGVFAIRQGKWKLILGIKGSGSGRLKNRGDSLSSTGQLYNMQDDSFEQNDLWDEHPDIVERLTKLLEKYKKQGFSRQMIK